MKKLFFIAAVLFASLLQPVLGQSKLRVIRADSINVSIRDGKDYSSDCWFISPDLNPDVYEASNKKVVFYTDRDSIKIKLKKGESYDFIVLLNGKDTAYTRVQHFVPYLEKLRRAQKYNYKDDRFVPKFEYQSSDTPELVKLRNDLKLDSIAGNGNDVSKMINLMYWVHSEVRHDGNSSNPSSKNTFDLLKVCREENRGVNCRMMATMLNECYLAMGFKSRFVTCMPKETEFSDCHVINMVYSDTFEKWIWMDPTFCAYIMDENGELLGISEVRERLAKGKTLIINPDANWNKQSSTTKDYYLDYYMAKNLYRLSSPLYSEYDCETVENMERSANVELLPLDGLQQTPQQQAYEWNGIPCAYYRTNNPDIFWAKPE